MSIHQQQLLSLVLGAILAIVVLYIALARFSVNAEELAFGANTTNQLGTVDGLYAHCLGATDSYNCRSSWSANGSPGSVLWLGNSQLPAINRMQPGDENAPQLLFRKMQDRGYWLVTYSQPNANLFEHAMLYEALADFYDPDLVILPVVYDDIREQGIRTDVSAFADDEAVITRLAESTMYDSIDPLLENSRSIVSADQAALTFQQRVEDHLTNMIGQQWSLWEQRAMLRGTLASAIHILRNQVLGIHSTTKRRVNRALYEEKMSLLDLLIARIRDEGRDVLVYIPPYRRDIDGPYVESEYQAFRADLEELALSHEAKFSDYESVVPGIEWATVTDRIFGTTEPDFMHFTADGHERFARALDNTLRRIGY